MKKSHIIFGIVVVVVIVVLLFLGIRGCYYHPYHTISEIDRVSVDTMKFSQLRNKYADLLTIPEFKNIDLPDTANVITIELTSNNSSSGMDGQGILDRIDQLYYNKYDNFISILTVLLSAFAIIIAFFGGYIPYMQSVNSKISFDKMIERLEKQEKEKEEQKRELEDICSRHEELYSKFTQLDKQYAKRIEKEKKRIEIIRKRIPPIDMSTIFGDRKKAKELLEKHYQLTENLLMLGVELEKKDYALRSARCIYQNDSALQDELDMWLYDDPEEDSLLIIANAYEDEDENIEAIAMCDMITAKNFENKLAWLIKGHSYIQLSDYPNAIKCYNVLLQLDKSSIYSHYYIAVAYAGLNQKEESLQHLKIALEKNKSFLIMAKTNHVLNRYSEVREMISEIEQKE